MKYVKVAKLAVKVCLVCVLIVGAVAVGQVLVSGIFSSLGWPVISTWWRLPLSVRDMVIDKNGTIHTRNVGERIQVYDSQGDFVNGWSFGKGAYLLLEEDGKSIIAVRQRRSSVRFDPKGHQLAQWEDAGHYERIADERIQQGMSIPGFKDREGNVFRQEGWILHSIVRIDPRGQKTIIVKDPIYVGIFDFGLGGLLIFLSLAALKLGPRVLNVVTAAIWKRPEPVDVGKQQAEETKS